MGFSRQEYWSDLPFFSPADHILSDLSTMTHLSWVALHGMAHSFIELDKAMVHVINLISFCDCGFHSVCPLMDKDKRLMEATWLERLTLGETVLFWWAGPCLVSFESNFLSVGETVFPPCCLTWDKAMVEVMKIMATSFKRSHVCPAALSAPTL